MSTVLSFRAMRTGAEYREALRDGRRLWIIGEGLIEDVTVHPATRATVDEYVGWYDRHADPEWQDGVLTPADRPGGRVPWSYVLPRSTDDLRGPDRQRQGRHAHQPGLRGGRVRRQPLWDRSRRAPGDVHRAGRRAGRHGALPQDLRPPRERLHGAAEQPLRRARRPDVARGRVHPLGADLPDGHE